eukprot:5173954-Lingulodinium_polyedra.AAC.1
MSSRGSSGMRPFPFWPSDRFWPALSRAGAPVGLRGPGTLAPVGPAPVRPGRPQAPLGPHGARHGCLAHRLGGLPVQLGGGGGGPGRQVGREVALPIRRLPQGRRGGSRARWSGSAPGPLHSPARRPDRGRSLGAE